MKQDIAVYQTDSFVDFEGKEHKIVACALSQSPSSPFLKVGWVNEDDCLDDTDALYHNIYRMVTIGIAICNPDDEYNEEAGKRIARNKAANIENLPRIYATDKGIITKELVDAFLKQQIRFFKENPGTLIPGYDEAQRNRNHLQNVQREIEQMSDSEKTAFDLAVRGVDLSRFTTLAKVYKKGLKND